MQTVSGSYMLIPFGFWPSKIKAKQEINSIHLLQFCCSNTFQPLKTSFLLLTQCLLCTFCTFVSENAFFFLLMKERVILQIVRYFCQRTCDEANTELMWRLFTLMVSFWFTHNALWSGATTTNTCRLMRRAKYFLLSLMLKIIKKYHEHQPWYQLAQMSVATATTCLFVVAYSAAYQQN